ncbi:hypothetical protein [Glaciecola sp. 1036]|uniref:hypothetical protein n=1 Tax=Alteromonadaceae TaxID=72275 RepID=UPI003CFCCAC3
MTNIVIVFLRDLLPIFILICYATEIPQHFAYSKGKWITMVVIGVLGSVVIWGNVEIFVDWFEGAGMEVVYTLMIMLSYLMFVLAWLASPKNAKALLFTGVALFVCYKLTEFLIFFEVVTQQQVGFLNAGLGVIFGIGICSSFAVLFKFALSQIGQTKYRYFIILCWSMFLAGLLSQISPLLAQVDFVNTGVSVFNLSDYVSDSSEYGHLLNALIGYESSPDATYLAIYSIAFLVSLLVYKFRRGQQHAVISGALSHE